MPTFLNDEQGYQDWFEANPDSWVVNAPLPGKAGPAKLHRNTATRSCFHITPPWPGHNYTQGKIKICFATRAELLDWFARQRPVLQTCQTCSPEPL